jgi:hypothetical protein
MANPRFAMSVEAPVPAGDPRMVDFLPPNAPLDPRAARESLEAAGLEDSAQKPLRKDKEPLPVADEPPDSVITIRSEFAESIDGAGGTQAPATPPPAAPSQGGFIAGQHNNTSVPPDTSGAVGPTHVMTALNNDVMIHDRTGALVSKTTLDRFWQALGFPGRTFDPKLVYDPFVERFIFVTMQNAESPDSRMLIAVSRTSDPRGLWFPAAILVDRAPEAQGNVWLDYPSLGFCADKITVSVNLFTVNGNGFAGATIYAFDKAAMVAGTPAAMQRFVLVNQGGTHAPAVTYDSDLTTQYLISRWSLRTAAVFELTGSPAANMARLSQPKIVQAVGSAWDSRPSASIAPQSGSKRTISAGDDRMQGACLRGGKLYAAHSIFLPQGGSTRSAVQWWVIDPANSIVANGRIDDPNGTFLYAFPSLSVNRNGDLMIGHAVFSNATFAAGAYTLKLAGAAAAQPVVFAPGAATYFVTFGGSQNRWGDYSVTQVDPQDDTTFWTCQEFVLSQDLWAVKWNQPAPAAPGGDPVTS